MLPNLGVMHGAAEPAGAVQLFDQVAFASVLIEKVKAAELLLAEIEDDVRPRRGKRSR